MVIFHSYVSLPEGNWISQNMNDNIDWYRTIVVNSGITLNNYGVSIMYHNKTPPIIRCFNMWCTRMSNDVRWTPHGCLMGWFTIGLITLYRLMNRYPFLWLALISNKPGNIICMIHHMNQPRAVIISYASNGLSWCNWFWGQKRTPCNVIQVKIAANYIDLHSPFIAKHLCYGFTVYPLESIRLWENVAVRHWSPNPIFPNRRWQKVWTQEITGMDQYKKYI